MKRTANRSLLALACLMIWALAASAIEHRTMAAATDRATIDREFIDMMMTHHRQGIEMAHLAETKGQLPQLKEFAARVIADQEKDVQELQAIRERLFSGQPQTDGISIRGKLMTMAEMQRMSEMDMEKLQAATGTEFDHTFLDLFIKHHQMAIQMSREVVKRGGQAEVKGFARMTISKQSKDIGEMSRMKAQVGGRSRRSGV